MLEPRKDATFFADPLVIELAFELGPHELDRYALFELASHPLREVHRAHTITGDPANYRLQIVS
jgi:hypothetical protein